MGFVGINSMNSMKIAAQLAVLSILWYMPLTLHADVDQISGKDLHGLLIPDETYGSLVVNTKTVSNGTFMALNRYKGSVLIALATNETDKGVACTVFDGTQISKKNLRKISEGAFFGRIITQNEDVEVSCRVDGRDIYTASIYSPGKAEGPYVFTKPINSLMPEENVVSGSPGFPMILY